ncbi:MAG: ATP-binding protein [Planctomycetota bacterium]
MGNTAQKWTYDNNIPSQPDYCSKVIEILLEQLEKANWQNNDIFGIHMALEEAILNAIHHGNHCSPDKDVHITIELSDSTFFAKIIDQGCGFNPNDVPDPTADENLEKCSGRGVMLMKNFVDEVIYNKKGNQVELHKKRTR